MELRFFLIRPICETHDKVLKPNFTIGKINSYYKIYMLDKVRTHYIKKFLNKFFVLPRNLILVVLWYCVPDFHFLPSVLFVATSGSHRCHQFCYGPRGEGGRNKDIFGIFSGLGVGTRRGNVTGHFVMFS